jgi:dolichyl-phosphate beta-glucosyltransferase
MGIRSKGAVIRPSVTGAVRSGYHPRDAKEVNLSLVIPVFNSRDFIESNLRNAATYLSLLGEHNEIVVVDDASTDGTTAILESLTEKITEVSYLHLRNETNQGKGYSVRRGLDVARGRHLVFNDADFTYPIGEVGRLVSYLDEGADVVIGCRIHPDSRYEIGPQFIPYFYTRHVMSRFFNRIVNLVLGLGLRDTQAGIKGFRRDAARAIFANQSLNRFSFDLEVLYIARKLGLEIREAPIRFLYRKEPSTVKFFRDSVQILVDILRIRARSFLGKYTSR